MSIQPGDPWGEIGTFPVDAPIVDNDAALAAIVAAHLATKGSSDELGIVGLSGGDLCRTLGGRGDVATRRGGPATVASVDVATATLSGRPHYFVAHLVATGPLWSGRTAVAMNAQWLGDAQLGPRAHPGDGLLDIAEGSLGPRERWLARSRARTGDHVPHARIKSRRVQSAELDLGRSVPIRLDGVVAGQARHITVEIAGLAVRVAV